MTGEKRQALVGSVWTLAGYGGGQFLRLGSNLLLAHMLFPAAFGVMALVTVVMQGLQMFSEIGVGPSIIRSPRGEDPDFLNTAWTVQVARGVLLWLGTCALAWPAASFFARNDPLGWELLTILPVIGFSTVLGGFNSTATYTLNRKLDIARVTMLELIPQIISVAVMIIWAVFFPSVWALVGGWMAYSVARLILSYRFNAGLRHRFRWEPAAVRELLHFGGWIFLGTIVAFLASSLDRLLLGQLLTLAELGLYSIALTFARVGIEVSQRLSHTVLFPLLSRYQAEPAKLVDRSLHARSLILIAGGALVCGFAIVAPVFFKLLYDPRYAAAGDIARWLAISVWANIVLSSMERVPLALGHARALFVSNVVATLGYGVAVAGYHSFGLPGFILGVTSGLVAAHLVLLAWVPVQRGRMALQTVAYTAVFGAYGGLAVWGMKALSGHAEPHWEMAAALATTVLPCGIAGLMALRRIRGLRAEPAGAAS